MTDADAVPIRVAVFLVGSRGRGSRSGGPATSPRAGYDVLIDGLDKKAIEELGKRLGRSINAQNSRTRDALAKIVPAANDAVFADPLENISAHRRLASHKVRFAAKPMRAFEQFTADLESSHPRVNTDCSHQ